jgi:fatty-acyl-CoA synthase
VGRRLGDLIDEAAARWGDREAVTFRDQRLSFRDLAERVDGVARGLIDLGVKPGEKVAIWLMNCPEWQEAMFACARIGAVFVPVNTRFRTADVEYVLRQSGTTTLITHDVSGPVDYLAMARDVRERLPGLRRIVVKSEHPHDGTHAWPQIVERGARVSDATLRERAAVVRSTDTLLIMYTSGTTGFPKGVMRDHNIVESVVDRQRRLETTERDVLVNYLPLFHVFGFCDGPLGSTMTGCRQVLMDSFDAGEALDLVEREGGTQLHGFELHIAALCDAQEARPRNLRTLRAGLAGFGQASAVAVARRARTVLAPLNLLAAYGMTEAGANVTVGFLHDTEEQACETSGYPCAGFEVRVIDPETGKDRPAGVPGELLVRSAYGMQGYHDKPEETSRIIDAEGWFHTGDMAILRADGYMRFIGRYKDMLKIGGENVDPMEVESYLAQHPAVQQVAVVSYPDARVMEVAVAFVQRVPGAAVTDAELIASCRGRIASFKIPRHVLFMDELPMTSSGKVQKTALRARALEVLGRPTEVSSVFPELR